MADPKRQGGAQPFFNDAVAGAAVAISAGKNAVLYSLSLANATVATAYLQIFFLPAASVILGTTVADYVVRLKTNAGAGDERDIVFPYGLGKAATTGLSCAGTTTATGAVAAAISVGASYA